VLAHEVMHDDVGRTGAFGSDEGADARVVGEERLDLGPLEPLGQVGVGAHRHEVDEPVELAADPAVFPQEARRLSERLPVSARRVGWGFEQELADDLNRLRQVAVEFRVDRRVLLGKAREALLRLGRVVAEGDVVAAGQRAEHIGRGQHLEPVPAQLQVGDDLRMEKAHEVAEHGEGEAGDHLLRRRRATDHGASLQHEGLEAGAGEVGPAGQAVVPAPDHDGVEPFRHPRLR
jgi:hypothetical protein